MADERSSRAKLPKPYPHATFPLPPKSDSPNGEEETPREKRLIQDGDFTQDWADLVGAFRLHRRRLLRMPGVTAVDIGYKIEKGEFTDKLALRVHVEHKFSDEFMKKDRPHELIPKSEVPFKTLREDQQYVSPGGKRVLMDVIEAEYRPAQQHELPRPRTAMEMPVKASCVNRRRRLDPLVGGISIGSPQTPVGTLGALVWDNVDNSVCILSNWHVLSGNPHAEVGSPCFQPGRFDQGNSNDVVARLKRWSFDSQTDAAIAELTGSRRYCAGEIISMFQLISGVEERPHLGMKVFKSGRSTGLTPGFIDGLYFSTVIEYSNGIFQTFEDQIHIAPLPSDDHMIPVKRISEPGDSGSVWVAEANGKGYLAVGLHFAGDLPHSAFGEYALANPMSIVMKNLDFSFRPCFLEIRNEDVLASPMRQQGNGFQPVGIIAGGRLTRSGGEPDPADVGSSSP